jgi:DNA helicase-2/ATP-dependent DNA helicase PcrA
VLTTFHSFCADILRQHGRHVGLTPDFKILHREDDQRTLVRSALARLDPESSPDDDFVEARLRAIRQCMDALVEEDQVVGHFTDRQAGERFSALYAEYRRQLRQRNSADFPSLLLLAHQLMTRLPAVAVQLRVRYPHLCVDEFQDTNTAQYRLLRHVAGDDPKDLFVVADDDQIIYEWNGASPQRLQQLREDYGTEVIQLPTNYRCPPAVVELANLLIRNNSSRTAGKESLLAARAAELGSEMIRRLDFATRAEEMAWIAQDIRRRGESAWGGCVVLARYRDIAAEVAAALNTAAVPAVVQVSKDEFQSSPFRWLHGLLRLSHARRDHEQLQRVCSAFVELEGIDVFLESAWDVPDYLLGWFESVLASGSLNVPARRFLQGARAGAGESAWLGRLIPAALAWFEDLASRTEGHLCEGLAEYAEERACWEDLYRAALARHGTDGLTLAVLLQEFDLAKKTPPTPPGAVRCYTIHASKGMEFAHVYLASLSEGVLPSYQSVKKGDRCAEMQEERRNCFVAITRTQASLTVTLSRHDGRWHREPSRFLAEMGLAGEDREGDWVA